MQTNCSPTFEQLLLPLYEDCGASSRKRRRNYSSRRDHATPDPLIETYARRLAAAGRDVSKYRQQLMRLPKIALRLDGRSRSLLDLFAEPHMLGRVLVDDMAMDGSQLSKWTLGQRRSAVRSCAQLMYPELIAALGRDPHAVIDEALRLVAIRVGGGYRLPGGKARKRGGYVPPTADIARVITTAGEAVGFWGLRNRAFLSILLASGCRVNALRLLDGTKCVVLSDGRIRLFLHEKRKTKRRQIELSRQDAEVLQAYMSAFNEHARLRGWTTRIEIGKTGRIWRNSGRSAWSYERVLAELRCACDSAGVTPFTPHGLRRVFATETANVLPRYTVQLAGGWQGGQRLDDHYIQPRRQQIWNKLHTAETADDELTKVTTDVFSEPTVSI